MHLQDALGQFQVQLAADGRSEHTRRQYERHGRAFATWLAERRYPTNLAKITPAIVAEFFSSDAAKLRARGGPKKATSANAMRTSLRNFFRWAHESGSAPTNAARLLKRARCAPAPPRALHLDEQHRLLDVLDKVEGAEAARDRMLVHILLHCGIRLGSALGLDIDDVDLEHHELHIRKAKGDRPAVVLMPKAVAKDLRAFLRGRNSGPLFLAGTKSDRRISTRHAQRRIAGWFAAAGITGRSAHGLRHSFAMRVYEQTGDLLVTQQALGHAAIGSTVCYAKVDRSRLRAAVGA
jgi:site-specific recombinase XerD